MKRQGLVTTIFELGVLIDELEAQFEWIKGCQHIDRMRKFQLNIVNKTPECSDTWEFEK